MSETDNHTDISSGKAPNEVPPSSVGVTPTAAQPVSSESGQTTADTSSLNTAPISPSVNPASNVNGTISGGSEVARQPSPGGNNSTRINQGQLDLDAIEKGARRTGTYIGGLIMTAAIVPIVAALISAIAFVVQWPKGVMLPNWLPLGTPLLLSSISTLIVWLLLAFMLRRSTAVDRINMDSYGLLINHLSTLDAQISILNPAPTTLHLTSTIANKEVRDCRNTICKMLVKKSLAWVTASGYNNLWKEMHCAEEALIDLLPGEDVIADALYDESRIQDSNIETRDDLLKKLRMAVMVLDPSVMAYLQSPPPDAKSTVLQPPPPDVMLTAIISEIQARSILREVRQALNAFRDSRWEAIVRDRNQFVCTTIFTGITLYVLLQFAILAGASLGAIISATAFYLVGALVGLFSRLYSESQTSKFIDDYRLALARLTAIPLYSGLAAVGGVLIVQKFTSLVDIFDPKNILSGLIIAALFGLTPNLLISTLQQQTDTYKSDLKSTAATTGQGVKTS